MIEWLIPTAWATVALLLTRPVYGVCRARSIENHKIRWPSLTWDSSDASACAAAAVGLSLAWPLGLVAVAMWKYMSGTKIRANSEIEAEAARNREKIAELEKELGLR